MIPFLGITMAVNYCLVSDRVETEGGNIAYTSEAYLCSCIDVSRFGLTKSFETRLLSST